MAYVGKWERLKDALARVIEASGMSEDEAKEDICGAISDGAIEIRAKPLKHATNGFVARKARPRGSALQIPTLRPKDIDWDGSRPWKPWLAQCGGFKRPGYWYLDWIELWRDDVTTVLCSAKTLGEPIAYASPESAVTDAGRAAAASVGVLVPADKLAGRKSVRSPTSTAAAQGRPRGRRPEKFERTVAAIRNNLQQRSLTVAILNKMREKELAAEYGVSRDTARKARDAILSELGKGSEWPTNSDNRQLAARQ
jgi:hypothetical protein